MKIVRGLRNLTEKIKSPVVALGNFDGVHVGHQEIFKVACKRASEIDGTPVVYTFDPHPLKILAPEQNLTLLTTFKKKMELISVCGIETTVCADFTRNFAKIHPRDFALKLKESFDMDSIVIGHDYSFGKGKVGGVDYLKKMGDELGFSVYVVNAVMVDGKRVSSTLVRSLVGDGHVKQVQKLLNRYYSIAGKVVSGYQRGKAIGFPTANLETPYELIPEVGVYAAMARIGGASDYCKGVVNVGYNPTFNRDDFIVEIHMLDLDHDIYGQEIEIFFVDRLRNEVAFSSVETLRQQIEKDVETAKGVLSGIVEVENMPAGR
ncbi:FMN adenylyltransferase / Riboflavin kinase [hydrothermal vent metagenome]|uniref:Bifunctional riboflavin kinase/FMN adenylyltransferase n=1 Tax=hydrothermal vent metagenome TaxID=652676 RepID=A0A3B1BF07_9ZZZZ